MAMYQPSAPSCPPPPPVSILPPGWTSHWSAEHQRVYYSNSQTGECMWNVPSLASQEYRPSPPSIQRKPVAASPLHFSDPRVSGHQEHRTEQPTQSQRQDIQHQKIPPDSRRPSQAQYTPPYSPPQQRDSSGYFPPPPRSQAGTPNHLYPASPSPSNHGPGINQSGPHHGFTESTVNHPQQYFPPPPMPGSQQAQQNGSLAQSTAYHAPSSFQRPDGRESVYYPPPPGQADYNPQSLSPPLTPAVTPSWQQNCPPQTSAKQPQQIPAQSYQSQYLNNHGQPVSQGSDKSRKPSGGMMGKIGSKFGQLQKTVAPGSTASPLKKWGTRAALGIGAIGALALGADVMDGGLFDGAAGSGFDTSGFDSGDPVAAHAAQLALEQQGQENALMLLDPPGTEYQVVQGNSLI